MASIIRSLKYAVCPRYESYYKSRSDWRMVITLLNQEDILFMIVWGLMDIEIQEETLLAILSYSW